MKLRQFLDAYRQEDIYCITALPTAMRQDIALPTCLLHTSVIDALKATSTNLWMSSGDAASVLHLDAHENFLCVIAGRKELLLCDRKYAQEAYIQEDGAYSRVDVDRVDLETYPLLQDIPYYTATLYPGDILYIPQFWLHQVRSYDRSIAINFWWNLWESHMHSGGLSLHDEIAAHRMFFDTGRPQQVLNLRADSNLKRDEMTRRFYSQDHDVQGEPIATDMEASDDMLHLFPTQVYVTKMSQAAQHNPKMLQAVYAMRDADAKGRSVSAESYNPHGCGYTSYFGDHSDDLLVHPEFQETIAFIIQNAVSYLSRLQFNLKGYKVALDELWANINPGGSYHESHLHQNYVVSGTYYIKVPTRPVGGELVFIDPREYHLMGEPRRGTGESEHVYVPQEGALILFPSWLKHEVRMNMSEEDRVSLSFNCYAIPQSWASGSR